LARLEEKAEWIAQLEQAVAERERELTAQAVCIEQLEQTVAECERELIKKAEWIAQLERTIAHCNGQLTAQLSKLGHHERVIEEINSSNAWKLAEGVSQLGRRVVPAGTLRRQLLLQILRQLNVLAQLLNRGYRSGEGRSFLESSNRALIEMGGRLKNVNRPVASAPRDVNRPPPEFPRFPEFEQVLASIIIPVHNRGDETVACLRSILQATTGITYEVIIVDDASTDDTGYARVA
jgi:hypothetical protein